MKPTLFIITLLTVFRINTFGQVAFNYQGKLCTQSAIQFTDLSADADTWQWDFGDNETSNLQNPEHIFTDSGNFTVSLTISLGGNESSAEQLIHINMSPSASFIADSTAASVFFSTFSRLFTDNSTFFNAQPVSYHWDFGDGQKALTDTHLYAYKYQQPGIYTVWHKVIDTQGCTDSISQLITISDGFIVPNVFTPNNDLINDLFVVISNGITPFSIDIYSRWGNLVFSRSGVQQIVWDGVLPGGEYVTPGTYFYVISTQTGTVSYESETGFVTVFH